MILFQSKYIYSIVKSCIKDYIKNTTTIDGVIAPAYNDIVSFANAKFYKFTDQLSYPELSNLFTMPPLITKELFDSALSDIKLYADAINNTPILTRYIQETLKYTKISQRFLYSNIIANNIVNELSNYSCRHIDIVADAEHKNIRTFNIGNYITLPFCIENAKCYSGPIMISSNSLEEIKFDNFSELTSIPLEYPVLVKYLSSSDTNKNTVTLQFSLTDFEANVIYINTYGSIESITLDAMYNSDVVFSEKNSSDEALFTFNKTLINTIRFTIGLSNYNTNKQVSFEVSELMILGNVNFSESASFETKQVEINDFFNINKIQINAINYTTSTEAYFTKYMSMSLDSDYKNFFQLDEINGTYIPSAKYTFTKNFLLNGSAASHTVNCVPAGNLIGRSQTFYKYVITNLNGSVFNFRQSRVLIGTNDAYGVPGVNTGLASGKIYENWTKIDNYYRTMLLNNEDNVLIDIGLNQIKINGQTVSGILNIPVGISMIDVHESIFDPTFGSDQIDPNSDNGLLTDQFIYGDKLYPYNFAYKIAGLPAYLNGNLDKMTLAPINVIDTSTVQIDSPFIALSVAITGNNTAYELHLGNTPARPGTYTIEPNKGIIKIHAVFDNNLSKYSDDVVISYTKASSEIKPCGILFNRLATYIDYKSIYNMLAFLGTYDTTFFSYFNDKIEEALLIPLVTSTLDFLKPYHNKIMYNTFDSKLFVSAKFTLNTKNTNISPAIKNVFIQGYK